MEMTGNEILTIIHGMVFGATFLLGFSAAVFAIYSMKPEWLTAEGLAKQVKIIQVYLWGLAISVWAAVLSGAYIVYPLYRITPPEGTTNLSAFPKFALLANASTAQWHEFGMEWKEHIAWFAPIAATAVAFIVSYYGPLLSKKVGERWAVMIFFVLAFAAAAIAALFGAFITKNAPLR
jgi:hypothetical protein